MPAIRKSAEVSAGRWVANIPGMPAIADAVVDGLGVIGVRATYAKHEEIFGEGESADYLYKVVSGVVRSCRNFADGRRQIATFYMPGDFFGLEFAAEHSCSCEAITKTVVLVFKRSSVVERAKTDSGVSRKLWEITSTELGRAQQHVLQLIRTAEQRVIGFLLEMASRGAAADEFNLPMSRQDIADHLGLTIETVSRTMTHLTQIGLIGLPTSRRVVLRNRAALVRMGD